MNYKEITSWEKACEVRGYDPNNLPDVSSLPVKFQKWLIANYKLGVITEAMNTREDGTVWTPDWSDYNQTKYTPWFEVDATKDKPNGIGFSVSFCHDWCTIAVVGSRLCFDDYKKVYHIQEYFKDLHLDQQLILE
jgi:hypothetical protein